MFFYFYWILFHFFGHVAVDIHTHVSAFHPLPGADFIAQQSTTLQHPRQSTQPRAGHQQLRRLEGLFGHFQAQRAKLCYSLVARDVSHMRCGGRSTSDANKATFVDIEKMRFEYLSRFPKSLVIKNAKGVLCAPKWKMELRYKVGSWFLHVEVL